MRQVADIVERECDNLKSTECMSGSTKSYASRQVKMFSDLYQSTISFILDRPCCLEVSVSGLYSSLLYVSYFVFGFNAIYNLLHYGFK